MDHGRFSHLKVRSEKSACILICIDIVSIQLFKTKFCILGSSKLMDMLKRGAVGS